ncbi:MULTISPECIES: response regulator [unclassified Siphonobacter]|uniref:response regulator n=1 Tax=unclassified Siphonobacter TaxID=2635712 RepID=UPI002784F7A2|nr:MULTISPECIES: response regulator [unclassified Siphonobacter]MDQ1090112.1 CheY-like chemotaxis protein [Siphonobacter sp. SORGH_AS_1065]MDR6197544.1 CheY-like chemotaxis protein [Siphonobacter sp. SORGH_AS_0500]
MAEKPLLMVVEDDPEQRFIMNWSYQKSTQLCNLLFAENAEQALLYLDDLPTYPSLMLLDYRLPGINGMELVKHIRQSEKWKYLPVVMFSQFSGKTLIEDAYDNGVNAFVVKPENRNDFLNIWNTVFDFWNAHSQLPKATDDTRR